MGPLAEVFAQFLHRPLVADVELRHKLPAHWFGLELFVVVFPFGRRTPRPFFFVVLGQVGADDDEELFPGRRLADAAHPQDEDGKVGVLGHDVATGVVQDELSDFHETELVFGYFLGSHGVPEFPELM